MSLRLGLLKLNLALARIIGLRLALSSRLGLLGLKLGILGSRLAFGIGLKSMSRKPTEAQGGVSMGASG